MRLQGKMKTGIKKILDEPLTYTPDGWPAGRYVYREVSRPIAAGEVSLPGSLGVYLGGGDECFTCRVVALDQPPTRLGRHYTAVIDEEGDGEGVSIYRDGIYSCDGRLDRVCLERGEAHIIDADAPLGADVYEALDEALTEAMERGDMEATVHVIM